MQQEPRNRAERRAALRKARRVAGSALAASSAALGTTAAVLNVTATPAGAIGFLVNVGGDAGDGTCDATCTLRDAIDDANASVGVADDITFDTAGVFSTPQTITLGSQLTIADDLTITGPAADLTIDGNDLYRIFYLNNGAGQMTVTISGLTLIDGFANGPGGAINNQGEALTLIDSTISGSSARFVGGAIAGFYNNGSAPSLTIQGTSTFLYNSAYYDGGAIHQSTGTIDISGTTLFQNNTAGAGAGGNGGAINLEGGDLTISGATTFQYNDAVGNYVGYPVYDFIGGSGGAIWQNNGDLTISGTTAFNQNTADDGGGAVYFYDGELDISGTTSFYANEAGGRGGGLWADDVTLSMAGTTSFTENGAYSDGGAIFVNNTTGAASLSGVAIIGNYSGSDGGGVYLNSADHDVTFSGSMISGNDAQDDGGGVYQDDTSNYARLLFTDTVISGNTADDGGGAYFEEPDGDVVFTNSTVSGNVADGYGDYGNGGGIYFYGSDYAAALLVYNTTISGNTANRTGGGVQVGDSDGDGTPPVSFFNSTISGNTADEGGAIALEDSTDYLYLVQSTITSNHTSDGGATGGIYLDQLGPLSRAADPDEGAGAEEDADNGGGGLRANATPPAIDALTLVGTIVSANDGNDIGGGDAYEDDAIVSDHSLIGTIAAHATITDLGGTIRSTNPGLAALANNGGPTQTHAVLGASAAIDTGPTPLPTFTGNEYDQRGPGFARVINGRVDIGAYEAPLTFADFTG